MRIFIAIELSEKVKSELQHIQHQVRKSALSGNFTAKDNFHLTIQFIGEVNEQEYGKIKSAMDKAVRENHPFQLKLSEVSSFKKKNKEIIWVSVKGNLDALHQLNRSVQKNINMNQLTTQETDYMPHLTLGRQVRLRDSIDELRRKVSFTEEVISVESLSLMESKRVNEALVYEPLYRIHLSNPSQ